jgi:hypothetical protein
MAAGALIQSLSLASNGQGSQVPVGACVLVRALQRPVSSQTQPEGSALSGLSHSRIQLKHTAILPLFDARAGTSRGVTAPLLSTYLNRMCRWAQ